MMKRAGKLYPLVSLAFPVLHPPSNRHSSKSSDPAALCIAPSTPPPPSKLVFAAFTIASTSSFVMSPKITFIFFGIVNYRQVYQRNSLSSLALSTFVKLEFVPTVPAVYYPSLTRLDADKLY